ncbi:MAG: VIT1/CCC1 transporter family protein [Pseudomonadota bacterium]
MKRLFGFGDGQGFPFRRGRNRFDHSHDPEAVRKRLAEPTRRSYTGDWIYGGFDGTVTTFAVVAGVAGAALSPKITLILGVANLVADGFSMAAGAYLSTKADSERYAALRQTEVRHVETDPEGETVEVREILRRTGVPEDVLEAATSAITANKRRWIDFMMAGEYGLTDGGRHPWLAGAATFTAFSLFGLVPLIPFIAGVANAFLIASAMTGLAFMLIGAMKARYANRPVLPAILESLAVGTAAATLAYAAGHVLSSLAS